MNNNFKKKIEEIKNSLNEDDIIDFVENGLGSDGHKTDNSGNLLFQTVDHNDPGEGSYKLYYYIDNKFFVSYTGDGNPMDLFELTQRAKHFKSFLEAYQYVCYFFHIDCDQKFQGFTTAPEDIEKELTDDWSIINKIEDYSVVENSVPYEILDDGLLELYTKEVYPSYWLNDGISPEAMDLYNIRVDLADKKIVIPHYDIDGKLIGIRGRSYDPWELSVGMKYSPIWKEGTCYRHELGRHFYGLDKCKETVKKLGKICLAESEKSAMLGYSYFGDNNFTVATCGSSGLSSTQIEILLGLGVSEVILAYDRENDLDEFSELSQRYQEKLVRLVQPLTAYFDVYYLYDKRGVLNFKDSPFDKGPEVLKGLMKNKIFVPSLQDPTIKRRKR